MNRTKREQNEERTKRTTKRGDNKTGTELLRRKPYPTAPRIMSNKTGTRLLRRKPVVFGPCSVARTSRGRYKLQDVQDDEIATEGVAGRSSCCPGCTARLFPSLQPQDVHAASDLRHPHAEGT